MKIHLLFFLALFTSIVNAQSDLKNYSDKLAKDYLQGHSGSLVIGIHTGGKDFLYYYGETLAGNKTKPDSNSLYETGQLSETFVSILYARLVTKGIIHADEKLKNMLPVSVPAPVYQSIICLPPDNSKYPHQPTSHDIITSFTPYSCFPDSSSKPQEILLCDLSTHTTGLPEYPFNLDLRKYRLDPDAVYTTADLYFFLKNYKFDKPIGYDYKHSSLGIAILAEALSYKMKSDIDSLLYDQVTGPLDMKNSSIMLSGEQSLKRLTGYKKNSQPAYIHKPDIYSPSLRFHSSAADMMKFLNANIQIHKADINHVLDYTHNARLMLTGKNDKNASVALGWKINKIAGEKYLVWQSGLTDEFASYIGFVETDHTGIIILSSCGFDLNTTGMNLMNYLAGQ